MAANRDIIQERHDRIDGQPELDAPPARDTASTIAADQRPDGVRAVFEDGSALRDKLDPALRQLIHDLRDAKAAHAQALVDADAESARQLGAVQGKYRSEAGTLEAQLRKARETATNAERHLSGLALNSSRHLVLERVRVSPTEFSGISPHPDAINGYLAEAQTQLSQLYSYHGTSPEQRLLLFVASCGPLAFLFHFILRDTDRYTFFPFAVGWSMVVGMVVAYSLPKVLNRKYEAPYTALAKAVSDAEGWGKVRSQHLAAERQSQLAEVQTRRHEALEALARDWGERFAALRTRVDDYIRMANETAPPWTDERWSDPEWSPAFTLPTVTRLGTQLVTIEDGRTDSSRTRPVSEGRVAIVQDDRCSESRSNAGRPGPHVTVAGERSSWQASLHPARSSRPGPERGPLHASDRLGSPTCHQ